jgi:hypothetical protein
MTTTTRTVIKYTPACPFDVDAGMDQIHTSICDEFEEGDTFAEDACRIVDAHRDRLNELLRQAWDTFVAETGVGFEYVQSEDEESAP